MSKRFLVLMAHPDDADIRFGGTAIQLARAGHTVKFVSLCNGCDGHYAMSPQELVKRRYNEAQASKKVSGISEYQIITENNDCELTPSLENRRLVIRLIREFQPDVVVTHRLGDYHADHRAVSQLVLDAAYLTQVPHYCPEVPMCKVNPVYCYAFDKFQEPRPFRADAAVPYDAVVDDKYRMFDCHVSQFYEWMAWENGLELDPAKMTWEEKRKFFDTYWGERYLCAADQARDLLVDTYGEMGKQVRFAETFEYVPYGRAVTPQEFRELFRVNS